MLHLAGDCCCLQVTPVEPNDPHQIAITNSFGMPSMDRDFLLKDIPAAQAALGPGQVRAKTQTEAESSYSLSPGMGFADSFKFEKLTAKDPFVKTQNPVSYATNSLMTKQHTTPDDRQAKSHQVIASPQSGSRVSRLFL